MKRFLYFLLFILVVPALALPSGSVDVSSQMQSREIMEQLERALSEEEAFSSDLESINALVGLLARKGSLAEGSYKQKVLEDDIDLLLTSIQDEKTPLVAMIPLLIPLSKYMSKGWTKTKRFVKKYEREVILGAIIVIAIIAVILAIKYSSPTTATKVAVAAGSSSHIALEASSKSPVEKIDQIPKKEISFVSQFDQKESFEIKEAIDKEIVAFKDSFSKDESFTQMPISQGSEDLPFQEKVRQFGSYLAHKIYDEIADWTKAAPELSDEVKEIRSKVLPKEGSNFLFNGGKSSTEEYESLIAKGHEAIDRFFKTNYSKQYTPKAKKHSSEDDITVGFFSFPGDPSTSKKLTKTIKKSPKTKKTIVQSSSKSCYSPPKKIRGTKKLEKSRSIKPHQNIIFTEHALQRAVERGITREAIFNALESPLKIEPVKFDVRGRPSQRFIGKKAEVVLNPETQGIVSVNPTSTKKAKKLINRLSNVSSN